MTGFSHLPTRILSYKGHSSLSECIDGLAALLAKKLLGSDVEPKVVLADHIKSNFVRVKNQLSVNICTLGSPH
ncbi:hypothetical protein IGI04_039452 [Brassica rapa subsp. trilocularis]|uniref:Uncharacterized protein n=1 Tax=Brassica rapa subsp. trilocularis TaxID=1813537 RepID=A0ABQ7KNZ7_BRACM|nr:hypothetical protein IGI04_039452 [Brassica rapa subsp. trilocularis]